jgi:broad specificity phosphatase PhoE
LRLYQFFFRYFSVSLEAFLTINHRVDYLVLRTSIEALEQSLGDPERAVPPSPEMYQQHRRRFLRILAKVLRIPARA